MLQCFGLSGVLRFAERGTTRVIRERGFGCMTGSTPLRSFLFPIPLLLFLPSFSSSSSCSHYFLFLWIPSYSSSPVTFLLFFFVGGGTQGAGGTL
jgi:hypothetical protein